MNDIINEINFKVYVLKDIYKENIQEELAKIIDKSLCKEESMKKFHEENKIKGYCFNYLYPLEKNGIYKKGNIYNFQIRCLSKKLRNYFIKFLSNEYTNSIKVLSCECKTIPKRFIEKIYAITPIIVKFNDNFKTQYWRNNHSEEEFFEYLRKSSIKKYEKLTNEKVDENIKLFNYEKIDNIKPISTDFKCKKILGDKTTLFVETSEKAQRIVYILIGTSLGDIGSRGFGFINYQYIK